MSTKTISITEEAYKKLAEARIREKESFSEVINRRFDKKKVRLSDFHGILSKKAGESLEKSIMEGRKKDQIHTKKRIKEIEEALD